MSSIQEIVQDIVDDIRDEHGATVPDGVVAEKAAESTPAMTEVLFKMVVDDLSLAFLDFEGEADTPFAALSLAVGQEIGRLVHQALEAQSETDEDES